MHANPTRKPLLPWRYGLFLLALASAIPFALIFGKIVGMMAGFDVAALLFLATMPRIFAHSPDDMRASAARNDANRTLILLLTGIVMFVLLVSIASELRYGRGPSPALLALILGTLVLAWIFSNLVYTLHYAFLYYSRADGGKDHGGLGFPDCDEPDYWDFAYFSYTLGMTFQTSDVEINSRRIRRVALFHSFAAFVFNLGIIAFSINILGSG